jgi:hypothetical protein
LRLVDLGMTSYDSITMPYLACVLVLMPVLGVRSYFRRKSGKPLPAKRQRYLSMIVTQIFLLTITAAVAGQNQLHLFGAKEFSPWFWVLGAAWLVLVATRLKSGWARLSPERKTRARLLLPESPADMRYWIPISILAGISEEWAYRGVAFTMLAKFAQSPSLAVIVCIAAFGIAHMFQGWRGILGTSVLAGLFHLLVWQLQSLDLAILIHAGYDLIVGVIAMKAFLREDGASLNTARASS